MNTDNATYKNCSTAGYMRNTSFAGFGSIIEVQGKVFYEVPGNWSINDSVFYDCAEFAGINVIQRIVRRSFGNQPNNLWEMRRSFIGVSEGLPDEGLPEEVANIAEYLCDDMNMQDICGYITSEVKPYTFDEMIAMRADMKTRKSIKFSETFGKSNMFYVIENVVYSEWFPIEWAIAPATVVIGVDSDGSEKLRICGPGHTTNHCRDCTYGGHVGGAFVGYCANCVAIYADWGLARGKDRGYLKVEHLKYLGFDSYAVCSLLGGPVPTGPDICDNQEDVDPVREDVVDTYCEIRLGNTRVSERYPRRAYGITTSYSYSNGFSVGQSDTMTPDFIRMKMESFCAANHNHIVLTDDNYTFPIGPRPADDYYRILKRPKCWYAWNITLRDDYGEIKVEIRLNVSNVHTEENPAIMLVRCNAMCRVRGNMYDIMLYTMKGWFLDEIDSPIMVIPDDDAEDV